MDELRFRLGCHAVHRCELLDERRELVTHGAWLFVGQEGGEFTVDVDFAGVDRR